MLSHTETKNALLLQKIRRIVLPLIFILPVQRLAAQAGNVWPSQPGWGDTLRISYHLKDTMAVLNGHEPIYAKLTAWRQDGSYRWYVLRLTGRDTLGQSFVLPSATASFTIRFYTLQRDDERAAIKRYVYDRKMQRPVAGAYWEDFFADDPRTPFEKEIGQYPQQYLTYAKYFNVVSMVKDPAASRAVIDACLPLLEKACRQQPAPGAGLLAALCVGHAKSGQLARAKPFLFELFRQYPTAGETALAFNLYNYEYYKASSKHMEADVRQQLAAIYRQWPGAALADDANVTWHLSQLPELTLDDVEKVLLPRYAQGSIPYYALGKLPELYLARRQKADSAKAMLIRFIRYWQEGSINHQYRLSAGQNGLYLAPLFQGLADAHYQLGEYHEAITQATAGMALLAGSNYEGNLLPDLLTVRASAYQGAGNLNAALEDYKRLYQSGQETALDSIRKLFPYCTVKEKSVEALAAALRKKSDTPAKEGVSLAPDFTGTDLQGRPVSLAALKGKIVVLNFWYTGCGPCIGEMPALNKLVEKYQHNDQVVFLAITDDPAERMKNFFAKRTFRYTVVNNAGKVNEAYRIETWPVHIVIGRNGAMVNRSTGAREDITAFLDRIIQSNL